MWRAMQAVRSRARWAFLTIAAAATLALAGLLLAVELEPRVAGGRPDAATAERTRAVAERLRALLDGGDVAAGWSATEAEMNAVLASAERLLPGMRGRAAVNGETLAVAVSVGAPLLPPGFWANLDLGFAESDRGVEVAAARVGRLPLPPALAERALRLGLDRALGPGAGEAAVSSVAALALAPGEARVAFRTDAEGRVPLLELLRSRARGVAGTDARALAAAQLRGDPGGGAGGRAAAPGLVPALRAVRGRDGRVAGRAGAGAGARRALRAGALLRRPRLRDRGRGVAARADAGAAQRLRRHDARRSRRPAAALRDLGRARRRHLGDGRPSGWASSRS